MIYRNDHNISPSRYIHTTHLREYLVKGFVMDDQRLKNPGGWDYFDELLERIREIRASEKHFYQKVRDLFALSSDYQIREKKTQTFFAEVQNKLLFAAAGNTAAELIVARANSEEPNMTLTSWAGSRVRKQDVIRALAACAKGVGFDPAWIPASGSVHEEMRHFKWRD
jgi:hypothetical protein